MKTKEDLGKRPNSSRKIENNFSFCTPTLALPFTNIDTYGHIVKDWEAQSLFLHTKKWGKGAAANYRLISLFNAISKVCAGFPLWKLQNQLEQGDILVEEPAKFKEGWATTDQCLVLQHLIENSSSCNTICLYAAFIDFKVTFDSTSQAKLWEKLEASLTDLHQICMFHEGTSLKAICHP